MQIRRLTDHGLQLMHQWLDQVAVESRGEVTEDLLTGPLYSEPLEIVAEIERRSFASRYEWARYIEACLQAAPATVLQADVGLWAWLTLVYFDSVCPKDAAGGRTVGHRARYIPNGRDFRTYYRHLLESPWRIVRAHREDPARALAVLSGQLHRPGEIAEQLASRQDLVSAASVMQVATALYIDTATGRPRRGAGGSGPGSPRRFAEVLLQFDVTYDIYGMDAAELLAFLPGEFARFRPRAT
jgi:hypothetical protein